jgi:hypothetical protein
VAGALDERASRCRSLPDAKAPRGEAVAAAGRRNQRSRHRDATICVAAETLELDSTIDKRAEPSSRAVAAP